MPNGLSGEPRIPTISGHDVAEWCREQHINQHQLAELLGMTQRNITVWVQEERGPPPWYVAAVLHYLECEGIVAEALEEWSTGKKAVGGYDSRPASVTQARS
jgi:predicted transcriptional regulator